MPGRSIEQRTAATLRRLDSDPNVWVATASRDGVPHLVPLSLAWDGERIVLVTPTTTPTARNIRATGKARASLDDADDVVVIQARAQAMELHAASPDLLELFAARAGWNPNPDEGTWSMLLLEPMMIHAWNGVHEIDGRTIMRGGDWIVP